MASQTRFLSAILTVCFCGLAQQATPPATPTLAGEAQQDYARIKSDILKAAEKVSAADYAFRPTQEIRTFGEIVAHLADVQIRLCSRLTGPQKKPDFSGKTSKGELTAVLKESFDECDKAYESVNAANLAEPIGTRAQRTRLGTLTGNTAHDEETYGTMTVYMRLKGLVPPSSEPKK